jgi:hypothetical protein
VNILAIFRRKYFPLLKRKIPVKFNSTNEALQYLSDITGSKVIVSKENIESKVVNFLIQNPNPNDKKVHEFAKEIGHNVHDLEAEFYKLASKFAKFLSEGRSRTKETSPKEIDPKELEMGIKIEKEHIEDEKMAEKIALDHLYEIPNYYTLLKKMEEDAGVED